MLKRWKKLTSKIVFENPWWTYKLDTFEIDGGPSGEYHYVHTEGSSMVIPVTAHGEILLVRQFRYLCQKESVELPCGSVKPGHSYLETAGHELAEETGRRALEILEVGEFNPYNGVTSEICKVYVARQLGLCDAEPDETEEFELLSRTPEQVDAMVRDGSIWDGMTLAAWLIGRGFLDKPG